MEEKQQLEEQMRAVMDKYKYKRRQIRELQEDLQVFNFVNIQYMCDNLNNTIYWLIICTSNLSSLTTRP